MRFVQFARRGLLIFLAAPIVTAWMISSASANTIVPYSLQGTFQGGKTFHGTLSVDLTNNTITAVDIFTSPDGPFGVNYTNPGSAYYYPTSHPNLLFYYSNPDPYGPSFELELYLSQALSPSIPTINLDQNNSYNEETLYYFGNYSGLRRIDSASLTATPLPATLPLLASVLAAAVGLFGWRRKMEMPTVLGVA